MARQSPLEPTLGWLKNLPEAGSVTRKFNEELARIADLQVMARALKEKKQELVRWREDVIKGLRPTWTAEEVDQARRMDEGPV